MAPGSVDADSQKCPFCGTALELEHPEESHAGGPFCPDCGCGDWFTFEDEVAVQVIKPTRAILRVDDLHRFTVKAVEKPKLHLAIDLSNVHYMSSAFLAMLISLKKQLSAVKGKLALRHLHPDLLEVFRITRLDEVFHITL